MSYWPVIDSMHGCTFVPKVVRYFPAQVDALLSQHGRVETMWMPTIKNLAYVIYESEDVAEDTRCARPPGGTPWHG